MYATAQTVNNNHNNCYYYHPHHHHYSIYELVTKIFTKLKWLSVESNVYCVPYQMCQLLLNGTQNHDEKNK